MSTSSYPSVIESIAPSNNKNVVQVKHTRNRIVVSVNNQNVSPMESHPFCCDICFEEVDHTQIYPKPCRCNINICWDCIHRDYLVSQKCKSLCPMCRCLTRFDDRLEILLLNSKLLKMPIKPINSITYIHEFPYVSASLYKLEDMIICVTYLTTKHRHTSQLVRYLLSNETRWTKCKRRISRWIYPSHRH